MKYLLLLTLIACSSSDDKKPEMPTTTTVTMPTDDRKECNIAKLLKSDTVKWSRMIREMMESYNICDEDDWNELMYWVIANDNLLYDDKREELLIRRSIECK